MTLKMVGLNKTEKAFSRQSEPIDNYIMATRNLVDQNAVSPLSNSSDKTIEGGIKESLDLKITAKMRPDSKSSKVPLNTVIPFITCKLCQGYLIDATTIVECLHTFCHSCIMIHLRQKQYCPCCELMINQTRPNIKSDAIRQAIVYKLVPGLYERELLRRQEFYRAHPNEAKLATPEQRGEDTENLIFSPIEKISLSIEYADIEQLTELDGALRTAKYLLCPASFTINMLCKFVLMKFGIDCSRFMVDISYKVKNVVLSENYTLMDVAYIYTWKRDTPMRFFFRVRAKEMSPLGKPLRIRPNLQADALAIAENCSNASVSDSTPSFNGETKLKLVKTLTDNQPFSDKKRVVYMVECSKSENLHRESALSEYAFSEPPVGVNERSAQQTTSSSAPKYRSLVEKENAKMKKLMQSLSEEKKRLKMQKREASKLTPDRKCDSIKLKISKTETGIMVIQNSIDSKPEPKDPMQIIGNVANCDENDILKKSLFLNTFQLTAKKSELQIPSPLPMDVDKGRNVNINSGDTGKLENKLNYSNNIVQPPFEPITKDIPAMLEKRKALPLKRNSSAEKLCQDIPRKKNSSYVKIAPKHGISQGIGRVSFPPAPKNAITTTMSTVSAIVSSTTMAPPLAPLSKSTHVPATVGQRKKLFKPPIFNMTGYSHTQFQTMPSPIYVTNLNAGSTPIYAPNSPQYSVNFPLPNRQEFKYTKLPSYVTNMSVASNIPQIAKPIDGSLITTSVSKSGQHVSSVSLSSTFGRTPGMSITATTTAAPIRHTNDFGNQIAPVDSEGPPEKQRKVESLLHSCNITFPSSLSITIANENDDQNNPGTYSKLKNPVNNYIEILKIPPENARHSPNKESSHPPKPIAMPNDKSKLVENRSATINKLTQPIGNVYKGSQSTSNKSIAVRTTVRASPQSSDVSLEQTKIQGHRINIPTTPSLSTLPLSINTTNQQKMGNKKMMPSLNPIEKTLGTKQNTEVIQCTTPTSSSEIKKDCPSTDNSPKETFQVEFLKFANDNQAGKPSTLSDQLTKRKIITEKKPACQSKSNRDPNVPKALAVKNNRPKTSMPILSALPALPTISRQQQEQEYAATLVKMAIGLQQHQRLAALQTPPFAPILSNRLIETSGAPCGTFDKTPQLPQNPHFNSLVQQARLIEHFERMKKAGKEAFEKFAQETRPDNKKIHQNGRTDFRCSKQSTPEIPNQGQLGNSTGIPPLPLLDEKPRLQQDRAND